MLHPEPFDRDNFEAIRCAASAMLRNAMERVPRLATVAGSSFISLGMDILLAQGIDRWSVLDIVVTILKGIPDARASEPPNCSCEVCLLMKKLMEPERTGPKRTKSKSN